MKIIVNPHKLEIAKEPVNEREIDITKCEFEFDNEITNDYVKEAYFTFEGTAYKQIIVNNECSIPYEVLEKKGQVEIGVVAFKTEGTEEIKRYNPSPAYFNTWTGSLKDNAENSEPITPSEMEQYEQALQDGLEEVNDKLDDIDQALEDVNQAITETNNLDLDVSKSGKTATVTLTKKDATTKVVTLSDGTSLMFNWDGTKLGIKTDEDADYTYVDLQGVQGPIGPKGEAFTIKKTYTSVAEMNADFNNMQLGDYVMIASTVEVEDNAKLYTRGETQWIFISDFSGATGIRGETGLTPNIQIGTVTSGTTPSVTRTGTNENPILNFVLEKGEKGDTGDTGSTGPTGNGIASITKTSTSGLVDTYTITFTDGSTTTFDITNGEDGEVTQEQLDEVQAELDRYKLLENALPHTENETASDYVTLENTAKSPMEVSLTPQTSQETTTGAQLYDYESFTTKDSEYTIDNDGFITANYSNDTDSVKYLRFYTSPLDLQGNTDYNIFAEIKESNGTGRISFATTGSGSQFSSSFARDISTLTDNSIINSIIKTTENPSSGSSGLRTIINVNPNQSGSITFRISVIANTSVTPSNFVYENFTGGIPSPNPDYPQDIHCTTGEQKIKIVNANLFNKNTISDGYIDADGRILVSVNYKTSDFIEIDSSIRYAKTKTNSPRVKLFDKNKQLITAESFSDIANFSNAGTFSIPYENAKYIRFTTRIDQPDSTVDKVMFATEGTLPSSYEENEETTYPLSLGNKEMYNINNVPDGFVYDETVDKFYIERKNGKTTLDTTGWTRSAYNDIYYFFKAKPTNCKSAVQTLSNYFIYNASYTNVDNSLYVGTNNLIIGRPIVNGSYIEELSDFTNWLGSHNTIVVYQLATSTLEEITNTTLISQLRAIKNALSMQGTTHIISTATEENLPFLIKARAVQNISNS